MPVAALRPIETKETDMLGTKDAMADLAVKNLDTARRFYEDTLGLTLVEAQGDEALLYKSGNTIVQVYRSSYAGTNKATALTWAVGDELEDIVRRLKEHGVAFEHYDMPGMTLEGDVHVGGDMKVAWFKDPDGNILCIANS
jgi:catechol 2,3-dioxygenase-like lactoylglutathione lyase family enzyme